jgi:hypothetical protein
MRSIGMLIVLAAAALTASSSCAQPTEQSGSSTGDMSSQAKAYLERAITLFREQHINAANMDW